MASRDIPAGSGCVLGSSREGRPVRGYRFGRGREAVSLLGGCHADEPVGPRLLRRLAGYLAGLDADDPMLTRHQWWIIPHINPDGECRNAPWQDPDTDAYDLGRYLALKVRELPGDDIEFGFPRDAADPGARPENRAAYDWWRTCDRPFALHVSLHGMGFAAGPFFLIDGAWKKRCEALKASCRQCALGLGYVLHDVERHGEKGFFRFERGFASRPDSRRMAAHFEALGDSVTASRFRPSSMEAVRTFGHDTLTLVSEMPLFILPGVGDRPGPPDPVAERWKRRLDGWRSELSAGAAPDAVSAEASEDGLVAMPVRDQMALQWTLIAAGLCQARVSAS
ncbi:MAG: peptidase [Gemmatimonadales bacterium]|nr:peptidase [Gemmatimonadales bacterium]MYG49002.1 peptidase [Gemmatimonadales bacterium]MYK01838.1 peptidase [Candidatus Palauibacter ramosifaciens]